MTKIKDAKPCPFCGGRDIYIGVNGTRDSSEPCKFFAFAMCDICGAKTRATRFDENNERSIDAAMDRVKAAWNRRTNYD